MRKFQQFWYSLRASLWFIPGLMLFSSIVFALVLVEVDGKIDRELLLEYPRIFGLGADGSRGMLTAIAGSMLTVATLAFSLTLSIIAQASGQYTPRILRNFMRDRVNQFILGYFVSVFAYCLVVLRTIRGADELKFVPSLAVIVGLVSALGGIIVLIYFIHHIATSLQLTNIIDGIVQDTLESINGIFPTGLGNPAEHEEDFEKAEEIIDKKDWFDIICDRSGYIQLVDTDGLLDFAIDFDLIVKMESGVGQFIGKGDVIATVAADDQKSAIISIDKITDAVNGFYTIYRFRSVEQDVGYGIRQIVDIALKALSPGVNDTTTAIICIDNLGVLISEIAYRSLPATVRIKEKMVRVFVFAPTFESFVETAFDQIRISGKGNYAVFQRLAKAIELTGKNTHKKNRLEILSKQLELIADYSEQTLETKYEKDKVIKSLAKTRKHLK